MDTQRYNSELDKLRQKYHITKTDKYSGFVIHDFNYPDGWTLHNRRQWRRQFNGLPRGPEYVAPLIVQVLKNWPQSQPYVYIPRDLEYTQGEVEHIIPREEIKAVEGENAAKLCPKGFHLWCVHKLNLNAQTKESSLPYFLRIIMGSFSYPEEDEPLRYVYENLD